MASIPLPALHVETPQQPSTLAQLGQLMQLKNAQQQNQNAQQQNVALGQENQMRAQQIQDQQAMTKAMQEWDGKDLNSLTPLVVKHGASAQAVMGLKSKVLEQQEKYSTIAKNDAETGSKNVETLKNRMDMTRGALNTVLDGPDQELGSRLMTTAQQLAQQQILDPPHVQQAQQIAQLAQSDPQAARQQLQMYSKSLMSESQQLAKAKDDAEIGLKAQQTREAKAGADIKQAEASVMSQGGMTQPVADARYRMLQQKKAAGVQLSPTEQNEVTAYEKQKLLVPVASANIRMEGMGKIRQFPVYDNQTKQTVYMDSNEINDAKLQQPGRFTVPQFTTEQVVAQGMAKQTQQIAKPLTAFNTAIQHLNVLDRLGADLNNGNVQIFNAAAQRFAKETGNPAPANFQAAANAMSGEVAQALKASGATDQEIAKVGSTFSNAQSPAQLKGAINTYRELLNSKRDQLKKQYDAGKQGQAAFGNEQGAQGQSKEVHYKIVNGELVAQ